MVGHSGHRNKGKANGEIETGKARIVATAFTQQSGVNFHETFVPVAGLNPVGILLGLYIFSVGSENPSV